MEKSQKFVNRSLCITLTASEVRNLEVMLDMLQDKVGAPIPAAQQLLQKLEQPLLHSRIVHTGLCSARAVS